MDDFGFGYSPPFYDPSPPNDTDMPAFVLRPVTKITSPGMIETVMTPVPCYYL